MHEHERWLHIAQEDLKVAKALLKLKFFSTVTYHCQQSAEKALKGYLVFKKHEIVKTHDLVKLVELCEKFDGQFEKIYDIVDQLNPFATKFRYPTEFDVPDYADAELAVKQAGKIMTFVVKNLVEREPWQEEIFSSKQKGNDYD